MSYKPMLGLTLIVILATLFAGCSGEGPKDVADKYLKATTAMNLEEAYKYVSEEGKAQAPLEKAIEKRDQTMNSPLGALMEVVLARTSYKITGEEIDGDTAKVVYTVSMPDPTPIIQDKATFALIMGGGQDKEKLRKVFEERMSKDDIKMEEKETSLKLIKENGVWKVAAPTMK